jgi:hypothetical protein
MRLHEDNVGHTIYNCFFLLGVQRSGTTLLRLLIDSHSQIAIPFESFVLIDFYNKIQKKQYNLAFMHDRKKLVTDLLSSKGINKWSPTIGVEDIDIDKCHTLSDAFNQIYSAYAEKSGKQIWGDKTPSYTLHLHILNELFPHAKFIHIIRDGRDVALSLVRQQWGPNSLIQGLMYWKEVVLWVRKMGRMLPKDRYMEIHFEDLVNDPKTILKQIMNFLEKPYEDTMLFKYMEKYSDLPIGSKKFHQNLKRAIDPGLAFGWKKKLSKIDQTISYEIAGSLFKELDYPSGYTDTPRILIRSKKFYYLVVDKLFCRIKRYFKFSHMIRKN